MTLVVPFDGSDLARAALVRANEFGAVLDEEVVAVSVILQDDTTYARERGWIGPDEPFDLETVLTSLRNDVTDLCPDAEFEYRIVDRGAPPGMISKRIRTVAREVDATMVFIGSENAGRIVTSVSSVGSNVATDHAYDVVIVRHRTPTGLDVAST